MSAALDDARELRIPAGPVSIQADLAQPRDARALVLLADAAARHHALHRRVARTLHARGFATLLVDLLTPPEQQEEARSVRPPLDMPRLTGRLQDCALWITQQPALRDLPLGIHATGPTAAAALITAARLHGQVGSVVCHGGRPELAGPAVLAAVQAATLLLVDEPDAQGLAHNEAAYQHLRTERSLAVVPGGGRGGDEAALKSAATMVAAWLEAHLLVLETA